MPAPPPDGTIVYYNTRTDKIFFRKYPYLFKEKDYWEYICTIWDDGELTTT